jgi:hypothetical protein
LLTPRRAAIPTDWITIALPTSPPKAIRRTTINRKELFQCESSAEVAGPYPPPEGPAAPM